MNRANKNQKGFSLIELLALIAIVGIVAALVISLNSAAAAAKRRGMVDAQKYRLLAAIDNYQSKLNFYPPDNGNLASTNAAYYDSTAAINFDAFESSGWAIESLLEQFPTASVSRL
jgi:prepilin-type N-terminal cleavage/methylation domain-containing protein